MRGSKKKNVLAVVVKLVFRYKSINRISTGNEKQMNGGGRGTICCDNGNILNIISESTYVSPVK